MKLKVLTPTNILIDQEVTKITAEANNGSFCILPRHIDFIAALVPGIFYFYSMEGEERLLALDEGILVKCASQVLVSTRNAVSGSALGRLKETVENQFRVLDEKEKKARSVLSKMEATFVRRFIEIEKNG